MVWKRFTGFVRDHLGWTAIIGGAVAAAFGRLYDAAFEWVGALIQSPPDFFWTVWNSMRVIDWIAVLLVAIGIVVLVWEKFHAPNGSELSNATIVEPPSNADQDLAALADEQKAVIERQAAQAAQDTAVREFAVAALLQRAIDQCRPIRPIPPPPMESAIAVGRGIMGPEFPDGPEGIYPLNEVENILATIDVDQASAVYAALVRKARARIRNAGEVAAIRVGQWHPHEQGRFFPDEVYRTRWHRLRGEIAEGNRIIDELKTQLVNKLQNLNTRPPSVLTQRSLDGVDL